MCPLCHGATEPFQSDEFRRCHDCLGVMKILRLSPEQQKSRYQTHNNTMEEKGYLQFLNPVVEHISKIFSAGAHGLDFGCGPGPVLAELLTREGYRIDVYDPFFQPLLADKKFNFITCTEAAEHFEEPFIEFKKMFQRLRPDGQLVIMTLLYQEQNLSDWYYARDPTHVFFYNSQTLAWIAKHFKLELQIKSDRLAVFTNKVESSSRNVSSP